MAGGGVKPGSMFGETDDFSVSAAGEEVPIRDFHATLLWLLGLDQNRLTYLNAGRFKKLTDIGGRVFREGNTERRGARPLAFPVDNQLDSHTQSGTLRVRHPRMDLVNIIG